MERQSEIAAVALMVTAFPPSFSASDMLRH